MRYGDRCNVMFIWLRLCSKHEICEWLWLAQPSTRPLFATRDLDLRLEPRVELEGKFQEVQMNARRRDGSQGLVRLAVMNHRDFTEI